MSIVESLKKLVDPIAHRERSAELRRAREQPTREDAAAPPSFECRVCGHLAQEASYCPICLADTMRPSDKAAPAAPAWAAAEPAPEPPHVELPVDGTLDLHTVPPAEIRDLLPAYLEACAERGIVEVRVVHGKGTGQLRRSVQALLERSPLVAGFRAADEGAGGWGATLVTLRASDGPHRPGP